MDSKNNPLPASDEDFDDQPNVVPLNPSLFGPDAKPAKSGLISLQRALLWLATGSKTIANDFKPGCLWYAILDKDAKITVEQSFAAYGTLGTIKTLGRPSGYDVEIHWRRNETQGNSTCKSAADLSPP